MSPITDLEGINIEDVVRRQEHNTTSIALLKQSVDKLETSFNTLSTALTTYISRDIERLKPNWAQWGVIGTFVFSLVAGLWIVLALKIDSQIYPLAQKSAQNEVWVEGLNRDSVTLREKVALLLSQNQSSSDDRLQLNRKVDDLQMLTARNAAILASDISERKANEREIETQFDADGQLRNIQFAEQQRMNKIIWNQLSSKLGSYPEAPYYLPNISARKRENPNDQH